jgi:hypothetical protein
MFITIFNQIRRLIYSPHLLLGSSVDQGNHVTAPIRMLCMVISELPTPHDDESPKGEFTSSSHDGEHHSFIHRSAHPFVVASEVTARCDCYITLYIPS